ncbi:MAG: hypothetical protein ACK41T_03810 [Pseudobdellovibrio sp.]
MKRQNLLKLFFAAATTLSINAHALSTGGLFVEPMITYEKGDTTTKYPVFNDSKGDVDGFGLGARLGLHIGEIFFAGIDGRYAMPKFKDSNVGYDAKAVSTNYGPVVGVQTPVAGLRVWGSYVLGGSLNPEKSGNYNFKYDDAKGYRVGAGFYVAAVSLNVEYQDLKYGNATLEELGGFTPGTSFDDVELQNKSWVASISFPVEL